MIIFKNFWKVILSKIWIIWFVVWFFIMLIPTYFFTWSSKHSIILWKTHIYFYKLLSLDIFLAILFWIFLWATLYKMKYFWNKKASKLWILWWLLASIVWWCASCSITLATYIWLTWFISFLPYSWLELKILSILFILYACYSSLKNLEVCNLKLKKS